MDQKVSILVVGGGPGGSTAAALLAKAGLQVLLLEREHFPRYHIGESLLASCLPTLRLSGAFDAVAEQGYTVKRGALIHWADDIWVLDWEKLIDPNAWSWQVDRASYDEVLLRNAAKQGAEVIEGATVKHINFTEGRPVSAEWTRRGDSTVNTAHFDYIIDASGRAGVLSHQHLGLRTSSVRTEPSGRRVQPSSALKSLLPVPGSTVQVSVFGFSSAILFISLLPTMKMPLGSTTEGESPMYFQLAGAGRFVHVFAAGS
jgi:flavin-dependent dehydrogenase